MIENVQATGLNNGIDSGKANNSANTAKKELGYYDMIKKIDPHNKSSGFGSWNVPQLMDNLSQAISSNPLQTLNNLMGGDFEAMKPDNQSSSGAQPSATPSGSIGNGPASGNF